MAERVYQVKVVKNFLRAGIPLAKVDDFEIQGKSVSIVFNGTTREGEALAIAIRLVRDWKIEQCLVRLLLLARPVTGDDLAREILTVLSTELGITSTKLLAYMRDRTSVNDKAMRSIGIMYPSVMDIGSFSHTLDLVGTNFKTPTLDKFTKYWVKLSQHSCKEDWTITQTPLTSHVVE